MSQLLAKRQEKKELVQLKAAVKEEERKLQEQANEAQQNEFARSVATSQELNRTIRQDHSRDRRRAQTAEAIAQGRNLEAEKANREARALFARVELNEFSDPADFLKTMDPRLYGKAGKGPPGSGMLVSSAHREMVDSCDIKTHGEFASAIIAEANDSHGRLRTRGAAGGGLLGPGLVGQVPPLVNVAGAMWGSRTLAEAAKKQKMRRLSTRTPSDKRHRGTDPGTCAHCTTGMWQMEKGRETARCSNPNCETRNKKGKGILKQPASSSG